MILNYSGWKRIFEQDASQGAVVLDFVVSAGATKVPISDEKLTVSQKFPTAKYKSPEATVYEISLADAMAGKFGAAVELSQATASQKDQIEFDGKKIVGSGRIDIQWTPETLQKKIKVSGNGALVLARAADQIKPIYESVKSMRGVVLLYLDAERFSARIVNNLSGLTQKPLTEWVKGLIYQVATQLADAETRPQLVAKWKDNRSLIEQKYAPPIIKVDIEKGISRQQPTPAQNLQLRPFYYKYSAKKLKDKTFDPNLLSSIKNSLIAAGLDSTLEFSKTFFKQEISNLPAEYEGRIFAGVQQEVEKVKAAFSESVIASTLAEALTASPGQQVEQTASQIASSSKTYAEGESSSE